MTRMAGKDALVELLRAEGIEYVFGIPGATEIHFMDALERAPDITYILGLQEVVCAGMAEGYARASGKVGFLNLHTGPGLAAALPLLYNSYYGGVPLVITAGQNHTRLLQHDPHLTGDLVGMMKPYTKWATEIVHPEDIGTVIQRAFKSAMQPPTGPVFVSLPQNVLAEEFEFQLTAGTTVYSRLRPDESAVDRAIQILAEARRPVILVESGVARSGALAEVVRFAELTGAKVYQPWMSDVNFPVSHPQYLGDLDPVSRRAKEAFADADLLVGIGCSLFAEAFFNPEPTLPEGMRSLQIDDNPWELGKNFPIDCAIQGDIKTVLAELNEALDKQSTAEKRRSIEARIAQIGQEKADQQSRLEAVFASEAHSHPISVSRLMTEVGRALRPDSVLVDECWSSSEALRQIVAPTMPGTFFRARKGGSIGWGLPGALGVQLGLPDKDVVAVVGDGSAAWSVQSLWTAARYHIPVTFILTNNATYRQVKVVRRIVLGDYPLTERHIGMELDSPVIDFAKLASSLGVKAESVTEADDLARALASNIGAGEPRLVEVFVASPS